MRFLAILIALSFSAPALAERVCVEEVDGVCLKYIQRQPLPPAAKAELALRLSNAERRSVQEKLAASGHYSGSIDGLFGAISRRAIRDWQRAQGHEETGFLSRRDVDALNGAASSVGASPDPRDGRWAGRLKCQSMDGDWGDPPSTRPEGQMLAFDVSQGVGVWAIGPPQPGSGNRSGHFHERWELRLLKDGRALIGGVYEASPTPARNSFTQRPIILEGRWSDDELTMSGNRGTRPCKLALSRY